MSYILFGIPNCSTVKKSREWLSNYSIPHQFCDFKKIKPSTEVLSQWIESIGTKALVNTKGTTWRGLSESNQNQLLHPALVTPADQAIESIENIQKHRSIAIEILHNHLSVIKRPVLCDLNYKIVGIGFSNEQYQMLFNSCIHHKTL